MIDVQIHIMKHSVAIEESQVYWNIVFIQPVYPENDFKVNFTV